MMGERPTDILHQETLLPAIQRHFVGASEQICSHAAIMARPSEATLGGEIVKADSMYNDIALFADTLSSPAWRDDGYIAAKAAWRRDGRWR